MRRLSLSFVTLVALSVSAQAGFIGSIKPDAKVGNFSVGVGQATFNDSSETLYTISFGGNYYYNNGVMWGASFGLGYTTNPDTTVDTDAIGELDGQFRLGYSFGKTAYGLGIYGIVDYSYLMYNSSSINPVTGQREDTTNNAGGIGYGAGAEYRFDSNWLVTATYTTATMTPDTGLDFDYDKALFSVGYSW